MLPWLFATIDFDSTPESYERYDKMSALDMFRSYGVSKRMYEEFIKPTLLVGLFAPPEELSAGATMGMLYYYGAQLETSNVRSREQGTNMQHRHRVHAELPAHPRAGVPAVHTTSHRRPRAARSDTVHLRHCLDTRRGSLQLLRSPDPRGACAALQHQNNFDVCWCKGSVAELLFAPLIERIQSFGGQIMGSQLVLSIEMDAYGDVSSVTARYAPLAQEQL